MCKELTSQMIEKVTQDFYSQFCGVELSKLSGGTHFICSSERDRTLKGLGCKYVLYIFVKDDLCVVSYSPKYAAFAQSLKKNGKDEIIRSANRQFKLKKNKLMVFKGEILSEYGSARILKIEDYPLYEAFFRAAYPNANPDGWLYEYFSEKTGKGLFSGYIMNHSLLSVCDAPDMPYMEGKIQHTGINTRIGERRKGYARCTAALATHHLIKNGICPQWECNADNLASLKLAKSIGYEEYGEAYILEEWA